MDKIRCLIVDDEDDLRIILKMLLERLGFHVDEDCCCEDALIRISQNQVLYGLILTDYHIPGKMSGLDLTKKLRGLYGNTHKIILMSGSGMESNNGELIDGILDKPFSLNEINDLVKKLQIF